MKEHTVPYTELNDIQLIRLLRQGEDPVMDYLLEKYKYLVRKRANALFLLGGDSEDLIQEGMIGLLKRSAITTNRWGVSIRLRSCVSTVSCIRRSRRPRAKSMGR